MKNVLLAMSLMVASTSAFAGAGSRSCTTADGRIAATYEWYQIPGENLAAVKVVAQNSELKLEQRTAESENGQMPLSVTTAEGKTITVSPSFDKATCTIEVK